MKIILWSLITLLSLCSHATAAGFDNNYEAYSGDFNGDGMYDLYVRQKPQVVLLHGEIVTPIVIPPGVDNFILQQTLDQTFTIVADTTNVDISALLAAPVELVISDFNIDGNPDVLIKDISAVPNMPANIDDQIVYAPSITLSMSVRAVDAAFKQFFEEVYGWILDEFYFDRVAFNQGWYEIRGGDTVTGWFYINYINDWYYWDYFGSNERYLDANDDPTDPENEPYYCGFYRYYCKFDSNLGNWLVYTTAQKDLYLEYDYSKFNQDALIFKVIFEPTVENQEIEAASTTAIAVDDLISSILEVDFMENVLTTGGPISLEDFFPEDELSNLRWYRIFKLFRLYRFQWALYAETTGGDEYFHYANEKNRVFVRTNSAIRSSSGIAYFTTQLYESGFNARKYLALDKLPVGFFILLEDELPGLVGPTPVSPKHGQTGGGLQWIVPTPIEVTPDRKFIRIPSGVQQ